MGSYVFYLSIVIEKSRWTVHFIQNKSHENFPSFFCSCWPCLLSLFTMECSKLWRWREIMAMFSNTVTHHWVRDQYWMGGEAKTCRTLARSAIVNAQGRRRWGGSQSWHCKQYQCSSCSAKSFFSSDLGLHCLYSPMFSKLVFVCWYLPVKTNPLTSCQNQPYIMAI